MPRVHYDCSKCVAYCCRIYERVEVKHSDLKRLAAHFGLSLPAARQRFTKKYEDERVLRRRKDPTFGTACAFLDQGTGGCTIYEARPQVCRDYPGETRCGYHDVLQFERRTQGDKRVLPIVSVEFPD